MPLSPTSLSKNPTSLLRCDFRLALYFSHLQIQNRLLALHLRQRFIEVLQESFVCGDGMWVGFVIYPQLAWIDGHGRLVMVNHLIIVHGGITRLFNSRIKNNLFRGKKNWWRARWEDYRFQYQEKLVPANKMRVERWFPSLFVRAETDCDSSLPPSQYIQIYEKYTSTFECTEKPIIYNVPPHDLSDKMVSNACSRPWNLALWRAVILPIPCGVG